MHLYLDLWGNLHIVFHNGYFSVHSHPQYILGMFFSKSLPAFIIFLKFLDDSIVIEVKRNLIMVLTWHFHDDWLTKVFLHVSARHLHFIAWKKCLFIFFVHALIGLFLFVVIALYQLNQDKIWQYDSSHPIGWGRVRNIFTKNQNERSRATFTIILQHNLGSFSQTTSQNTEIKWTQRIKEEG